MEESSGGLPLALACDHIGLPLKQAIAAYLDERGVPYQDFGTNDSARVDYPRFAQKAAEAVASGRCRLGILVCGTGVGMSLAANKVRGIRCVCCSEPYSARLAREHNDANLLALGARVVGSELACMIVENFLEADFAGGRHQARVQMISAIEAGQSLS